MIGGEYFGWSYGWGYAGTLGFSVTVIFVTLMYLGITLSFSELASSMPSAGGALAYCHRAFGVSGGFIAGFCTFLEFLLFTPSVALAVGSYLHIQFPMVAPKYLAMLVIVIFTVLNLRGVKVTIGFELLIGVLAAIELLVFMGVVSTKFSWANFCFDGWGGQGAGFQLTTITGIILAIPFAMWFFLGIEGIAMTGEECYSPEKSTPRAFVAGILTLAILAFGLMIFAGGIGDWHHLANINDPLPQAMIAVVGQSSSWVHMLVWMGVFGLLSSINGNFYMMSRQVFSQARLGYLPAVLGRLGKKTSTPYYAVWLGCIASILLVSLDGVVSIDGQSITASLVILSALCALAVYIINMLALIVLRKKDPDLKRPFKVPLGVSYFALIAASFCFIAVAVLNLWIALLFLITVGGALLIFHKMRAHLVTIIPIYKK